MKRLKKFFFVFLIGIVSVVLTFGTFSVVSADTLSYDDNKSWLEFYEPIGPAEGYTYYVVFEFDTSYKVIYLHKNTIGLANSQGVLPSFVYSSLLGTQHYLTLSIVGGYNAYVYDVPKSFLDSGGLFSDFTSLNYHILKCDWDLPTVSEFVDSSISSSVKLTYSFNGPEIVYVSNPGLFYWSFPPVVAGNFSFEIPSAFIVNQAFQLKVDGTELYDVFREQAAYEGGYLSSDSGDSYDKGYDAGYEVGKTDGYEEGIGEAERGIFATAKATAFSFDTAPYEFPLDSLYLDPISYGISFRTIGIAADRLLSSNDWSDTFRFSVTVEFDLPFVFSRQSIFVSQALGFYSLMFYDVNGRVYEITDLTDDGSLTTNGYPLVASSGSEAVYGQLINKWVVEFANPDYIGNFISPFEGVFQSGYITGYDEGYDVGHNKGYNEGHNDGFLVGRDYSKEEYAAEMTGWDLIADGFSSVLSVFNIKVFGIISLGDIFSIVLIFSVVFFVFKLIRG